MGGNSIYASELKRVEKRTQQPIKLSLYSRQMRMRGMLLMYSITLHALMRGCFEFLLTSLLSIHRRLNDAKTIETAPLCLSFLYHRSTRRLNNLHSKQIQVEDAPWRTASEWPRLPGIFCKQYRSLAPTRSDSVETSLPQILGEGDESNGRGGRGLQA